MSDKIPLLRLRAFIGIVTIILMCPFVLIWKSAPWIWEALVETWDREFSGALEVAWAIVRYGTKAKDHTNVRFSK